MSRISLKQFTDKYAGKNVNVPWGYAGECVSLVQRYINECHGLSMKPRGNAVDWSYTLVNEGVAKKVSQAQYGDILVYGKPFGLIQGKYYGHVAIYINGGLLFDQNNSNVKPTRTAQFRPLFNVKPIAILRMNTALVKDESKYEKEVYAFTANTVINIRANYNTNAKIVGTLKKGETFNYIGKIEFDGYVWITNGKDWVAVREVKNGIRGTLWGTLHAQKDAPKPVKPKPPVKKEKWLRIPTTITEYSYYKPNQSNKVVGNRWGVLKPTQYKAWPYLEYKVIAEKGNFKTLQLNGNPKHPLIDIFTGKGTEHAWNIVYK